MGGVCIFWDQTEEDWLKIVFIPGAELAHEREGIKSVTEAATEQTALIAPVLRTHGKMEEGFFQTKQPWWQWEGGRLTVPDRRRRK